MLRVLIGCGLPAGWSAPRTGYKVPSACLCLLRACPFRGRASGRIAMASAGPLPRPSPACGRGEKTSGTGSGRQAGGKPSDRPAHARGPCQRPHHATGHAGQEVAASLGSGRRVERPRRLAIRGPRSLLPALAGTCHAGLGRGSGLRKRRAHRSWRCRRKALLLCPRQGLLSLGYFSLQNAKKSDRQPRAAGMSYGRWVQWPTPSRQARKTCGHLGPLFAIPVSTAPPETSP